MTASILIIEDETEIRRFLRATVGANGFTLLEAETAHEGLQKLIAQRPDVIILDLGLPDRDGQDFIRDVREWSQVPIIVVSAREQEADKVLALENGADDYLTKPFAAGELLARIKVALRHAQRLESGGGHIYDYDGLSIDLSARRVTLDGGDVHLTPIEYKLLSVLAKNAGKVLTHAHIMREVWGAATDVQYLRIYIRQLRHKIEAEPDRPALILTESGVGYRLRVDD